MSAIGPGDLVTAVRPWKRGTFHLTTGALYRVASLPKPGGWDTCCECGVHTDTGVLLVGMDPVRKGSFCRCFFAPWPGPADAALRCERVEADSPLVPA